MAQEEVVISVGVDASKGISTLKDLKKELKEAKNAALNGDGEAAKRVAQLEDRLEDLKDTTKAVKGDGLEPLRNSFNLFKDGITNLDFGKIGTAFKGLGAAMKAVPIFLLVEGITYLITNFKELSEGTGILAQVLKPIGDLFTWIIDKVYQFTDAIGLTNSELDKMGEAVKTNADKARESLALQTSEYDRQIAVAKAAGKSTVELEKAKQEAIVKTNEAIVKQIEAFVRAGGVLDEEKRKILTSSLEAIKNAKVEERVIDEAHQDELDKKNQEAYEKWKKINDQKLLEEKTRFEAKQALDNEDYDNEIKVTETKALTEQEIEANKNAELLALSTWRGSVEDEQRKKEDENKRLSAEKELDHKRTVFENSVALTAQSVAASQKISDLYFAQQLKSAKGNADKEREIKKKQFNINKAFGITNAVIDGVRGVQSALAQGPPMGYVFAALTAVMAAINVAQIASAKFDDSGASSGGGGGEIGSMGTVGASAPSIAQPNNTVTKIDDNGEIKKAKSEQPVVKAVVVETDVTDSQKRVNSIKESATF